MAESAQMMLGRGQVLAVDDQPENLALLEDVLSEEGFDVRLASDGQVALEEVERQAPDCIVLDIMMPRVDGFSVCSQLKGRRDTHFIPIVMLTALSGVEDKVRAYELGADDFLNKPVNLHELVARVRSMIRIKRLRDELDTSESIIISMVEALESAHPQTGGHSQRVALAAVRTARGLHLPTATVELIAKGAILHDLGKIGIPLSLVRPPEEIAARQLTDYRQHTLLGELILSPFLSFAKVRALVRHHHERRDGHGFPDRLVGDELDLESEIVAVANLCDHLVASCGVEGAAQALRVEVDRGIYRREVVEELLRTDPDKGSRGGLLPEWHDLLPLPGTSWTGKIVIATAAPSVRDELSTLLAEQGHDLVVVDSEAGTRQAVSNLKPDLVLLDLHLPGRGGVELVREIKERPETEFLPIIVVTAESELDERYRGRRVGADDFLFLPINRMELIARVKSLLRLRLYFRDLEEHQSVILSLASALEAKDPYTRGHSERVGVLAAQLARTLGLPEADCQQLRVAGQLHDLGKIGMPETLLNKQGRLTDEEFATVMTHPVVGERICRPLRSMQAILPLMRQHHERFDGTGYPDHLRGEDLRLGARILGLADAYDALTSERSYRRNYSPAAAIDILAGEAEAGRWDPRVFAALTALVRRG